MLNSRVVAFVVAVALQLFLAPFARAAEVTVVDGDSIIYDGRAVEIWGIIAPAKTEMCSTTQHEKWLCGERALAELAALASDASFVCEEKEAGFVSCRVGGLDVALLLVGKGLVRSRQGYRDAEARARESKVGLWQ